MKTRDFELNQFQKKSISELCKSRKLVFNNIMVDFELFYCTTIDVYNEDDYFLGRVKSYKDDDLVPYKWNANSIDNIVSEILELRVL